MSGWARFRLALEAALLVGLLGALWSGLAAEPHPGRIAALCALGALPAAALLIPWRPGTLAAVAGLAALPAALALAVHRSPFALLTFDGGAWGAVRDVLPQGLRDAAEVPLPLVSGASPALGALFDCALAAAAAVCAWQVIARCRPLVAVVVVGVALAYRWTVVPPEAPVVQGALALAAALAVLALDPARPGASRVAPVRGIGLAAGAICVAVVLGAGPLGGSGAWWDWREWSVGGGEPAAAASALDLQQRYGRLAWPEHPTVVVRVSASRALPLRAAVLDRFDGLAFTAAPDAGRALRRDGSTLVLPGARGGGDVEQRVSLEAGDSEVLLAGGRPVSFTGPFDGRATIAFGGVRVDPPLRRGQAYTVRTRVPEPRPADLLRRSAYAAGEVPAGFTDVAVGYGGAAVRAPLWGTGQEPDADRYGPYSELAAEARRLGGAARSPYAAVNRIEGWLRASFVYDETPPYPPAGVPPLADFVDRTKRGFCQHFAGTMAVMLRTLGIPARVAVGYAQGHWDARRRDYEVWDRDAHSWVEVLLPGAGWLAFDPTPGRSAANPASVSSPDYTPPADAVRAGGLERASVRPPARVGPAPTRPAPPARPDAAPAPSEGGGEGWAWALLALALLPLGVPAAKLARRARRRRMGDERARVLAAARELESRLADLGMPVDPAASPSERAAAVRSALGVDVDALYERAASARYGRGPTPRGQGAWAWRDLARATRRIRRRTPLGRRLWAALRPLSLRREPRTAR